MSGKQRGLDDRTYRRMREALKAQKQPCHICKRPIDTTLPPGDPMSFTADHVIPRSLGGSLYGQLLPAHRSCNSRRSNRVGTPNPIQPPTTSRDW
ncbi:MAG: HNH endonuclease [Propionibacteriaceae bacterium]|jgi:5-methylcytosine-specific restriction endonuclease McrA|nr:HNH endonuclease [Propionibacteriaceae bacterium]